jgi:hypothetical protein
MPAATQGGAPPGRDLATAPSGASPTTGTPTPLTYGLDLRPEPLPTDTSAALAALGLQLPLAEQRQPASADALGKGDGPRGPAPLVVGHGDLPDAKDLPADPRRSNPTTTTPERAFASAGGLHRGTRPLTVVFGPAASQQEPTRWLGTRPDRLPADRPVSDRRDPCHVPCRTPRLTSRRCLGFAV